MDIYGRTLGSRFLLGTAQYPSPTVLQSAVRTSRTEMVTVSLRREAAGQRAGQEFWSLIRSLGVEVLPNTAGCHSVKEAVTTAHMAREVFDTQADADLLSVYARDPDNPQRGWARFTFGGQPLRIISWVLVNEAGEETRVVLSPRQKTGHDISPRLFSIGAETNERAPRRFR
jgi:hypothetical protein